MLTAPSALLPRARLRALPSTLSEAKEPRQCRSAVFRFSSPVVPNLRSTELRCVVLPFLLTHLQLFNAMTHLLPDHFTVSQSVIPQAAEAERKAEEARKAAAATPRVPLPMQPAQPALTPHSPSPTTATSTRASLTMTPTPPLQSARVANFTAWTHPGNSAPTPPMRFTCARPTPGPPTPLFSQMAAPTGRLWHHLYRGTHRGTHH
jgi:hypothetical protein